MNYQPSLLPLRVVSLAPSPFVAAADLKALAITDDGQRYAVKRVCDGAMIPASEWIGYRLAESCQIAVPYSRVLELPDGDLAFGSRLEHGTVPWSQVGPADRMPALQQCSPWLSRTLALDLFLCNGDRHADNFLFRRAADGTWAAWFIDCSRALFAQGFPDNGFPIGTSNTRGMIELLRQLGVWNRQEALFSIARLQSVSRESIDRTLADMPPTWLSDAIRLRTATWWQSYEYHARLSAVLTDL